MRERNAGGGGFTLVEILIALAIVSGALVTFIYTVNYHLQILHRHESITVATLLGREKILTVTPRQRDKTGKFAEPFGDYSYEIEIDDSPFEDIKLIRLTVSAGREKVHLVKFAEAME